MALTLEGRWSDLDTERFGARGSGVLALVRAVCTPANLTFGAVLALAWLALIGWTGAGPDGWQARICADLHQGPQSCAIASLGKDQSRVAPVAVTAQTGQ
ncbi:hypothetical protein CIW48_23880 [Methylobacterium sp. P1-11]|uniref:hypothetical protein n=1 Tax=Methylobacterium sp. P1-11 TaxID=2024616 RepID=UPI0011EEEE9D|nr:hypothetical protein [Methylobacterium sp. P1-11]KAA0121442.1 hypothetical protein CIW48_23880 [Methylobacterium sp. P1-11]